MLVIPTTTDPVVNPGEARRFAAKMEKLGKRVFFYEQPEGGHDSEGIAPDERATFYALLFSFLGAAWPTRQVLKLGRTLKSTGWVSSLVAIFAILRQFGLKPLSLQHCTQAQEANGRAWDDTACRICKASRHAGRCKCRERDETPKYESGADAQRSSKNRPLHNTGHSLPPGSIRLLEEPKALAPSESPAFKCAASCRYFCAAARSPVASAISPA